MTNTRTTSHLAILCVSFCLLWALPPAYPDEAPAVPQYWITPGHVIIDGDIQVPVECLARFRTDGLLPLGVYEASFWPGGLVPYEFDANVTNPAWRQGMRDAMDEWEAVANVRFTEVQQPPDWPQGYLHIQNHPSQNNSPVGYGPGIRVVNIVSWSQEFIMAHELGHSLGFWHEQSRPDRDQYVIVHTERVGQNEVHNFIIEPGAHAYGPYDFDSVMHYAQCDFTYCTTCDNSTPNCWTIEVRAPWNTYWQSRIGQRSHFSYMDKTTISMMYPWSDWVFVDGNSSSQFEFGTFAFPYKAAQDGVNMVPAQGTVIIQPGVYTLAAGIYSKPMRLRAPLGSVTIMPVQP